jgi:methionyl-tRNA formyltransferase
MPEEVLMNCVVASSREWHREGFEELRHLGGTWAWADTPEALVDAVFRLQPRYVFFLHWNWKVPQEIWSRFECVCFHMTDVPYGRGGSPLQNLIAAGHEATVLSALRMVEALDAGPVYAKHPLSLQGRAEDIYIAAGRLSFDMIGWIIDTQPQPQPQEGEAIVFNRRRPAQSKLPETVELKGLYDHIRMLDAPGYPLAFIDHGNVRIEFSRAELQDGEIRAQVCLRPRLDAQE